MKELWRKIDGYPDYFISNLLRIKSKRPFTKYRKPRIMILKQPLNQLGYHMVYLMGGEKREKAMRVHRLYMQAFIPNLEGKKEINHINGIRSDNRPENLEWITHAENIAHAYKIGNRKSQKGIKHKHHKKWKKKIK